MSKEAMKLALEALETSPMSLKNKDAIIVLREALAEQPAQQCSDCNGMGIQDGKGDKCPLCEGCGEQPAPPPECQTDSEKTAFAFGWWKALEHVRQQPAKQQAAYTIYDSKGNVVVHLDAQPAQQEPVAICEYCEKERPIIQVEGKPWVGLTDEQWKVIANTLGYLFITRHQKEIIEAALGIKEKNNG